MRERLSLVLMVNLNIYLQLLMLVVKKPVVIIEKSGDHGIKRAYVKKIENTSSDEIRPIFTNHVGINATVKTDKWTAYTKLSKEFNIVQEKSNPKVNFKLTNRLYRE